MRRETRGVRGLRILVPAVAAAAYSTLLARTLPLTFDEARNWLGFSQHGVGYVTENYLVANNHVLFTALQALLPASLVRDDPLNLRLINIVVAVVLVTLMFDWLVREGVPWSVSIAGLLLTGPLTVLYLGVARGYLLGTLLAFAGIHLLARWGRRTQAAGAAGVLFALAIYTVPTFALGMPGVGILLLWRRRGPDALIWAATATVVALLLYLPILHQVLDAARGHPPAGGHRLYGGTLVPGKYSFTVLRDSLYLTAFGSTVAWVAVAGLLAAALVVAVAARRPRRPVRLVPSVESRDRATTVFELVAAYSVGTLVVIELANATRLTSAPFYRNSLFVGFAVVLWLLRELRRTNPSRRRRLGFGLVVGANIAISIVGVSLLVRGLDYSEARYGDVLLAAPPPTLRSVAGLGATAVYCTERDMQVCGVYAPYLARRGVHVRIATPPIDRGRCATGSVPPIPLHGVIVRRGPRALGVLCQR
jgi:hypothetical protein